MTLASLTPREQLEWVGFCIIAIFFIGVGGRDFWLISCIARYMKEKHSDAWSALSVSSPYTIRFLLFVRNKEYLDLRDPQLNQMFAAKKRFDKITGVLFIAALAIVLLVIKSNGL